MAHVPVTKADPELLRATMRINTRIFAAIFGVLAGLTLLALAIVAVVAPQSHAGLLVVLLGVFLPGYGECWLGALAGLIWGIAVGSALGAAVYWMNTEHALARFDELVALDYGDDDFPA